MQKPQRRDYPNRGRQAAEPRQGRPRPARQARVRPSATRQRNRRCGRPHKDRATPQQLAGVVPTCDPSRPDGGNLADSEHCHPDAGTGAECLLTALLVDQPPPKGSFPDIRCSTLLSCECQTSRVASIVSPTGTPNRNTNRNTSSQGWSGHDRATGHGARLATARSCGR
jgi:hypothetical protein